MTPEEFKVATRRTDIEDYSDVQKRIKENKDDLYRAFGLFLIATGSLDFLKKKIMYNPNPQELLKLDAKISKEIQIFNDPQVIDTIAEDETLSKLLHYYIGVATEANECVLALVKAAKGDMDIINITEEHSDLQFYLARANDTLGLKLEDQMDRLVDKLKVRYPDKFTEENAINRNETEERKALEGEK
jgi:phosphoribosyl-ATP pyrophosphohydrolase